jgi:hypothetical protein
MKPPLSDWPITIDARWTDLGYSPLEVRVGLAFAAAFVWMTAATLALAGRVDARLVVVPVVIGVWLGWRWIRRRPSDIEVVLEPERMRIRHGASAAWTELRRDDAGVRLAAETGLDWNERLLVLADSSGQEFLRTRARTGAVQVPDVSAARDAWWRATMPAGSSPQQPPTSLPVTALIGTWWPQPDARRSIRGNLGLTSRWKEPDLVGYSSWDRRQRRLNNLLVVATLLFVYGLAIAMTSPLSGTEIVAFLPPGVIGVVVCLRNILR